jgi:response regulator RpfG family c-di-GMP phosphodiesterase
MNLTCPFCSAKFRAMVGEPLREAVRMACPACQRQLVLRPPQKSPSRPAGPSKPAAPPKRRVVMIDEPRPFRSYLENELTKLGYDLQVFESSDGALEAIRRDKTDLVVINVSQKHGKTGVEIAEEIKGDPALQKVRVALTGALFRANRFRKDPATLYGADDYFEEQIPAQELAARVESMLGSKNESKPPEDEAAQRLARLILSDIVIANPSLVEQGIRNNNFFDVLKKQIDDGRIYYESHVSMRIRQYSEYYTETFQDFVELKREEL